MNDLSEFVSIKREFLEMLMEDSRVLDLMSETVDSLAKLADASAIGTADEYESALCHARAHGGYEPTDIIRAFIVHSRWLRDVCIPQALKNGFSPEVIMREIESNPEWGRREFRQKYVYFLRRPDGAIKIGCTQDVEYRRKVLECSSGHELELLGCIKGGFFEEGILHQEFAESRTIGEWFSANEKLIDRINELLENERALLDSQMQPPLFASNVVQFAANAQGN